MTRDELIQPHADSGRWLKRTRADASPEPEIRRMLRDALIVLRATPVEESPNSKLTGYPVMIPCDSRYLNGIGLFD